MTEISVDLRELSGVDPDVVGIPRASLYLAPFNRLHVEDGGDDYILTENARRVSIVDGLATFEVPPTPVGSALVVMERGFSGARKRYVLVPDSPTAIKYGDLVDVDPATLDPEAEPDAAWVAELESRVPDAGTDGHVLTKGTPDNVWLPAAASSLPIGGTAGEVLTKQSGIDGDADWAAGNTFSVGGVLSGSMPNPGFAVNMAEQSELDTHTTNTANPHAVTKTQVGLGNVDNTSDASKPISTATQTALDAKANTTALTAHTSNVSNPHAVTKAQVGLANVDNTSDAAKPVSTAQQTALNLKANTADLGTAAAEDVGFFATAAQGALADTALQPGGLATVATSGSYNDLIDQPTIPAQVNLIEGTNVDITGTYPDLTITASLGSGAVETVNEEPGPHIVLDADDISDTTTTKKFTTAADITKLAGIAAGATANATNAQLRDRATHTGTQSADTLTDGTTNKAFLATERTKLSGIATGATANATDAQLRDRSTHTGTQSADTLVDGTTNHVFTAADDTKLAGIEALADVTDAANVAAALDADLTDIAALTPSNDDVIQRKAGAWTNRTMAQVKTDLTLVKGDVGLGNVDNTSDATKNSATATLTNKRITKRVFSTADTATLTIDSDSYDGAKVTALAQAMTIAAPTGTPTAMQGLIIRILDNGTARALTWDAAFRAIGVTLPTTTVISKTVYVGVIWNSDASKWDAIAVATQA